MNGVEAGRVSGQARKKSCQTHRLIEEALTFEENVAVVRRVASERQKRREEGKEKGSAVSEGAGVDM